MPIVTWCDEYSVNIEEIDTQHQRMLELVNNLHSSVEACVDKNDLKRLLVELVEFTGMHFATEERLMKEHDYPDLVKHHKEHRMLLRHLNSLVTAVSGGEYPTFYSDYDVSSDWALNHISEFDTDLGVFLNSRNVY
jgi:hemerythrin-like metal-binding protein